MSASESTDFPSRHFSISLPLDRDDTSLEGLLRHCADHLESRGGLDLFRVIAVSVNVIDPSTGDSTVTVVYE